MGERERERVGQREGERERVGERGWEREREGGRERDTYTRTHRYTFIQCDTFTL